MKTNGRSSKVKKPFVPAGAGAPLSKSRDPQGNRSRARQPLRPLFLHDNPNFDEIQWIDRLQAADAEITAAQAGRYRH